MQLFAYLPRIPR